MTADQRNRYAPEIEDEFLHWISVARKIISEHFPAERSEPHNQVVIDTARSLMIAGRLEAINTTLAGLRGTPALSTET